MRKLWQDDAWEEYLYWQTQDKKQGAFYPPVTYFFTITKDTDFLINFLSGSLL